jgi:toxin HigB-1
VACGTGVARRGEAARLGRGAGDMLTLDVTNASRYYKKVIQSFADDTTERVWNRERAPRLGADMQRAAQKKLRQLNAANNINDLRIPPGNRLEKLAGNRAGQHSIRINDQYRICFVWTKQGPADVEITDYH